MDDQATNWFAVSRDWLNSELWLHEEFTRGQAWIDLVGLARWRDGHVRVRGIRVDLERGQLCVSTVQLANRWKWGRTKVTNFLAELENKQQITQQKNNVSTVISLVNFDTYQPARAAKQTPSVQQTCSKRAADLEIPRVLPSENDPKKGKKGKKGKEGKEVVGVADATANSSNETTFVLPLQRGSYALRQNELEQYKSTYSFDVERELRKALQWLTDNKRNRPRTSTGAKQFATRWLNRTDATHQQQPAGATNGQDVTTQYAI